MARRPWFQFSLMTAIVMMFTASGLLWLNTKPYTVLAAATDSNQFKVEAKAQGWPFCFILTQKPWCIALSSNPECEKTSLSVGWLVADALVNLGIVLLSAIVCEGIVRRKDRERQLKQEGSQ
jgi:hypothetical protein